MAAPNDRDHFRTFFGGWNGHAAGPLLAGPMVGDVGETTARIWVQGAAEVPLTLTVSGPNGRQTATATPSADEWLTATLCVSGLAPNAAHTYAITSELGSTPQYSFRTAVGAGARALRIAFGSCFFYHDRPQPIFDAIRAKSPNIWVMAGDNCYYMPPDWENERTKMLANLRNRNNPNIRPLLAATPTIGVWDDHDYGPNDADGTYADKAESLRVFRRMWAQPDGGLPGTEGIFFSKQLGPVELFFLDMRWHRREKQRILGEAQWRWLVSELKNSAAPVKVVVSGSQVLPDAPAAKGWECFRHDGPAEVDGLLDAIVKSDIRGVVFASGDVHLAYLLRKHGKPLGGGLAAADLWELTSSPLANDIWHENLVSHGAYDPSILREIMVPNFGFIDVNLDRPGKEIILTLAGASGNALVERAVPLARLAPHPMREKLVPLVWADGNAYFFRGDKYHRFGPDAARPDAGYPMVTAKMWKGLYSSGIEAAVLWNNKKAYFFKGNGYICYDIAADKAEPGPRYIGKFWRGLWPEGIDAGALWNNGKAYFFRGSEYVRYDVAADRVDPGYPKSIKEGWPGVWPDGIDGVALWPDGSAYFFKGDQHIRYDVKNDRAYPGGPRSNGERWPGLTGAVA
jgi:alkaline phosphatase D